MTLENDEVFNKSKDYEDDTDKYPANKGTEAIRFWDTLRDAIVHVDQHKEEREEESKSPRNCFSTDSETDPAGANHQETRSKVKPDVRF